MMSLGIKCIGIFIYSYLSRGGFEVHVFDVGTTKFGTWCAHNAVPHDFGRYHVGRAHGELVGVIDDVAANDDSHAVWVVFLWTMVNANMGVGDCAILWDAPDFVVREKKDSVSTNGNALLALHEAM